MEKFLDLLLLFFGTKSVVAAVVQRKRASPARSAFGLPRRVRVSIAPAVRLAFAESFLLGFCVGCQAAWSYELVYLQPVFLAESFYRAVVGYYVSVEHLGFAAAFRTD